MIGADPDTVEALLEAQLRVEFRRQRSGSERVIFVTKLAGQLLLGTLLGLSLLIVDAPLPWMTFAQAAVLVFTTFGTLEAIPHLLVERRDLAIVGSAPVTDTTFFVSRVIEVAFVVGLVTASLALPIAIFGLTMWPAGPFLLVFTVSTVLSGALALFATLVLYLGILRLFPVHKAREVLLFAQVGLTILIFGSLQLGPRLTDRGSLDAVLQRDSTAHLFIPPLYYGEWFRALVSGWPPPRIALLVLGLAVPLLAAGCALFLASSGLLARMQQVPGASSGPAEQRIPLRRSLLGRIADLILADPTERVGYDQFRILSRRERGFRLRTYPTIALSVIFAAGYLISFVNEGPGRNASPGFVSLPVYFAFLYAPIFVLQTRYSDDGDARWIFDVTPIAEPGRLITGMAVGLALHFLVPVSLLIGAAVVVIGGIPAIPHVAVAVSFILFSTFLTVERVGPAIPFSEPFRPQVGMTNFGLLMLTGVTLGAAISVHMFFVVLEVPGLVWVLVVGYLLLARAMLRRLRRQRPRDVEVRWFPGGRVARRTVPKKGLEERDA